MNRMLEELACAMLRSRDSPEFLWEQATEHAAYAQDCTYTWSLENKSPYEVWFGKKPHVNGLQELGAPIWVLLQGQMETWKMLPKGIWQIYGYKDGPKAMKYYNPESRKILTLRNFHFFPSQK